MSDSLLPPFLNPSGLTVQEAHAAGATMLFLPEACSFIGHSAEETVAHASPLDGPVLGRYRGLAQRLGIWISCGGFQETSPDAARIFNTHVLLDPQVGRTYTQTYN